MGKWTEIDQVDYCSESGEVTDLEIWIIESDNEMTGGHNAGGGSRTSFFT